MVTETLRRYLAVLLTAVTALLAGSVFARIFEDAQLMLWLALAVVLAVAIAVVAHLMRAALAVSVLLAFFGFLALGAAMSAVVPARDGQPFPLSFLAAMTNTGAELLTVEIPVPASPGTLLLPMAATWLGAAVAAETLLRSGRALLALAGPLVTLVIALIMVGPSEGSTLASVLVSLALLICGALALVVTRAGRPAGGAAPGDPSQPTPVRDAVLSGQVPIPPAPTASRLRRILAGVAGLAVLAASVLVLGPLLGNVVSDPGDPRTFVAPPQQKVSQSNPLSYLGGWAQQPDRALLQVRTSTPERIRWTALDSYDGLSFTPESDYRSAGSKLPKIGDSGVRTVPVTQRLRVLSLYGAWLPAVAQPREVKGVQVSVDTATGSLIHPQGLSPGLTYDVRSERPDVSTPTLTKASVPSSGEFSSAVKLPAGVPKQLVDLAHRIAARGGTPYQRALLLEQYLKGRYEYNAEAVSGHGLVTLNSFLTANRAAGGGRGTSEQFAASYVVLARILGLPTRIVVGFHAGNRTPDGWWQIRSGDAFAWPEVYFSGAGWVPFDPTPQDQKTPPPPEALTQQAKKQQQAKQQQYQQLQSPSGSDAQAPDIPPDEAPLWQRLAPLWITLAVLVVLLAIPIAFVVARRVRRRRRLWRGSPPERIIGSWAEVLDLLRQDGTRPKPHLSASEIAASVDAMDAAGNGKKAGSVPSIQPLADLVNLVGFADGLVGPAEADQAGQHTRDFLIRSARARKPFRRLLLAIDPRPLVWRAPHTAKPAAPARSRIRPRPPKRPPAEKREPSRV